MRPATRATGSSGVRTERGPHPVKALTADVPGGGTDSLLAIAGGEQRPQLPCRPNGYQARSIQQLDEAPYRFLGTHGGDVVDQPGMSPSLSDKSVQGNVAH